MLCPFFVLCDSGGGCLFFFEKKVVIYEILLLSLRLNKEQGVGSKE